MIGYGLTANPTLTLKQTFVSVVDRFSVASCTKNTEVGKKFYCLDCLVVFICIWQIWNICTNEINKTADFYEDRGRSGVTARADTP